MLKSADAVMVQNGNNVVRAGDSYAGVLVLVDGSAGIHLKDSESNDTKAAVVVEEGNDLKAAASVTAVVTASVVANRWLKKAKHGSAKAKNGALSHSLLSTAAA